MKLKLFIAIVTTFFSFAALAEVGTAKAYVKLFPIGDFVAQIKGLKGSAQVSNGSYSAKNLSLELTTLQTGMELRDNHAKDKYLEVKKFPTVTLIEANGSNGKGTGKLQLKNKTNQISGTYKISPDGKSLAAVFSIKLSEFGIEDISYKGLGVEDDVKIEVNVPVTEMAAAVAPAIANPGKKPSPSIPSKKPPVIPSKTKPQPPKKN